MPTEINDNPTDDAPHRVGPNDVAAATNARVIDGLIDDRLNKLGARRMDFVIAGEIDLFAILDYSKLTGSDGFVDIEKTNRVIDNITDLRR